MDERLDRLVDNCTVYIQTPTAHGTGFFVAPGLVLTCAHVIKTSVFDLKQITIRYQGKNYPVEEIIKFIEDAHPDIATLRIQEFSHPCVFLDEAIEPFSRLYSFGYTREHPQGESVTLECEGRTFFSKPDEPFLKLKGGQVLPGASGSPLLNWQTGKVCGILKFTRDASTDIGGGAIPADVIFTHLPFLRKENLAFHQTDTRWAKAWKRQLNTTRPVSAVSAILYKQAGKIQKPKQLFGREKLLGEINTLLDKTNKVLLCGFTGLGKTALAATIVDKRIADSQRPIIWLNAGYATSVALVESMTECLDAKQTISNDLDGAQQIIHDSLNNQNIQLIVIDDARDGVSLKRFTDLLPNDVPVLVTSQHHFPLDKIVEISELSPTDALKTLEHYAGQDAILHDPEAKLLCEQLGFHTYALEIAGDLMKVDGIKAKELRRKLTPHELEKPEGLAQPGREGLRELLEYSLKTLDDASRKTFLAFGAFFTSGATIELISAYLSAPTKTVEKNLSQLTRRSLVKRRPETNYYYLQDIAFSYVRAEFKEERHEAKEIVAAVNRYLADHADKHELLALDMPNILGTANLAEKLDLVRIMSVIVLGNYPEPSGLSYFDERGHTLEMLERLEEAIEASHQLESKLNTTLHYLLVKQGYGLYDRGDFTKSVVAFQSALDKAPNTNRQAKLLCVISSVLVEQGNELGYHYIDQAYHIAKHNQDDDALSFAIQSYTHLANQKKDYEVAHRFAVEAVEMYKRLSDPVQLGYSLLNLGSTEFALGNFDKALSNHSEALAIAQKEEHLYLFAHVLHALAEDYHTSGQPENAQKCFDDALELCRQSGDVRHATEILLFMKELGYVEAQDN